MWLNFAFLDIITAVVLFEEEGSVVYTSKFLKREWGVGAVFSNFAQVTAISRVLCNANKFVLA